jgi:hypothetical protein
LEVRVGEIRIVMRDAYYPLLQRFSDGSIVMTGTKRVADSGATTTPSYEFIENPEQLDSIKEADRYYCPIKSSDGGSTWTPAKPLPYRGRFSSKGMLADGSGMGLASRTHPFGDEPGVSVGRRWVSEDNWATVREEPTYVRTPQIFPGYADQGPADNIEGPCFHADFLNLPNGDIVAPMHANFEEDTKFTTTRIKWRAILARSGDGGKEWEYVSTIASMASLKTGDEELLNSIPQGFVEPSLALLPDGSMVCAIRTGVSAHPERPSDSYRDLKYTHFRGGKYHTTGHDRAQPLYLTRSTDGGATWCKPRAMSSARGACPRLLALSNGVLALSYGRIARPSQGNRIIFSLDGGETWSRETDVYPGLSSGYTDMLEMSPGRILYLFDTCTADGPKVPDWIGAVDIEVSH